jgi:hypothetical protein
VSRPRPQRPLIYDCFIFPSLPSPPLPPFPRRQHFREEFFRCPFHSKIAPRNRCLPNFLMLPTPLIKNVFGPIVLPSSIFIGQGSSRPKTEMRHAVLFCSKYKFLVTVSPIIYTEDSLRFLCCFIFLRQKHISICVESEVYIVAKISDHSVSAKTTCGSSKSFSLDCLHSSIRRILI